MDKRGWCASAALFVRNPARAYAFARPTEQMGADDHGWSDPPEPRDGDLGAYARPSWLVAGLAASARGEFGPADLREMLDDAVDLALRDRRTRASTC